MGESRIDPNFVVPEPTAARHFSYFPLPETPEEMWTKTREAFDLMEKRGAKKGRVTIVNDENPVDGYPYGVWLEGWDDEHARMLPFGEAETPDGPCSPPLMADTPKGDR